MLDWYATINKMMSYNKLMEEKKQNIVLYLCVIVLFYNHTVEHAHSLSTKSRSSHNRDPIN